MLRCYWLKVIVRASKRESESIFGVCVVCVTRLVESYRVIREQISDTDGS